MSHDPDLFTCVDSSDHALHRLVSCGKNSTLFNVHFFRIFSFCLSVPSQLSSGYHQEPVSVPLKQHCCLLASLSLMFLCITAFVIVHASITCGGVGRGRYDLLLSHVTAVTEQSHCLVFLKSLLLSKKQTSEAPVCTICCPLAEICVITKTSSCLYTTWHVLTDGPE